MHTFFRNTKLVALGIADSAKVKKIANKIADKAEALKKRGEEAELKKIRERIAKHEAAIAKAKSKLG